METCGDSELVMFNTATYNSAPFNSIFSLLVAVIPPSVAIPLLVNEYATALGYDSQSISLSSGN